MAMTTKLSAYRWFPWALVGSLGVVVAVNLVLTYFAFSSSPGLVTAHPYDEGNGYNAVLATAAREEALSWRGQIDFAASGAKAGALVVSLTDKTGQPLTGTNVIARIERPVEPLPEINLPLPETAAGRYAAALALSRPGQWDVHVTAERGSDRSEFSGRIFVK